MAVSSFVVRWNVFLFWARNVDLFTIYAFGKELGLLFYRYYMHNPLNHSVLQVRALSLIPIVLYYLVYLFFCCSSHCFYMAWIWLQHLGASRSQNFLWNWCISHFIYVFMFFFAEQINLCVWKILFHMECLFDDAGSYVEFTMSSSSLYYTLGKS